MKPERLEEIKQANQVRTPGKWGWAFNLKAHSVDLRSLVGMEDYVINFKRWGTQGAQPFFQNFQYHIIETFTKWAKPYASYACQGHGQDCIEHPDARFIAKAPEYVTELLELVEEQAARIKELESGIEVPN